jgi:hypothetical protein
MAENKVDALFSKINFSIEALAIVPNHEPLLVAHVRIPQRSILLDGLFQTFIPRHVGLQVIELLSPIRCSDYVQDRIVAIISQDDIVDAHVV